MNFSKSKSSCSSGASLVYGALFALACCQLVFVADGLPRRQRRVPSNDTGPAAVTTRSHGDSSKNSGKKDTRILSPFKQHVPLTNRFEERESLGIGNTEIVFPDSDEDPSYYQFHPSVGSPSLTSRAQTASCKNAKNGLCERVENYPAREIDNILRGGLGEGLKQLAFGRDEDKVDIANRNTNDQEENSFCISVRKTIYPQLGITRDNLQKYIINYGNLTQGVLVEMCRHENKKCDIISDDILPDFLEAKCTQKYIYRRLISYDENRRQVAQDSFLVPSACCCTYRKRSILSRIALPKTAPKTERKCTEDL